MKMKEIADRLAEEIIKENGRAYYVGGCVRDTLCGKEKKDVDIEVYGITQEILQKIVSLFSNVDDKGKKYGIYCVEGIDIALPRIERKTGEGHRAFEVELNPYLDFFQASKRRDFRMNALLQDILTGEIIDVHEGRSDIQHRCIRHICADSFVEDPLRVYRAARFASQLSFQVNEETILLAKSMNVDSISKQRKKEELKKALLGEKPSLFFKYLWQMNHLPLCFQEVAYSFLDEFAGLLREDNYWAMLAVMYQQMTKEKRESFWQEFAFSKEEKKGILSLVKYFDLVQKTKADNYFLYRDLPNYCCLESFLVKHGSCYLNYREYEYLKNHLQVNASYLLQMGYKKDSLQKMLEKFQRMEINEGFLAVKERILENGKK